MRLDKTWWRAAGIRALKTVAQTAVATIGSALLTAAWHDPGAPDRAEGTNDYVVLPGLISQTRTFFLPGNDNSFLTLRRRMPEMDFVIECQNRLWGCRWGGGVNELYASSLGDFKNWSVFEGLSTDSYRVSRGVGGAFTGAAVLGGCPLFFRADSLEKIYPAAGGDHGGRCGRPCHLRQLTMARCQKRNRLCFRRAEQRHEDLCRVMQNRSASVE